MCRRIAAFSARCCRAAPRPARTASRRGSPPSTDWRAIASLYARLEALRPAPVDDGEHARAPLGQVRGERHPVGDTRVRDLALRARQAGGHGRLGHVEQARDLARRQSARVAQGERDPCRGRERRMADGEDQAKALVVDPGLVGLLAGRRLHVVVLSQDQQRQLAGERRVAAQPVAGAAAGDGEQPARRVRRRAARLPLPQRRDVRVLQRLLGQVEAAQLAREQGEQPRPVGAERSLDRGRGGRARVQPWPWGSTIGRISVVALGSDRTSSSTWSRSRASISK
jgi:hypothetical protein